MNKFALSSYLFDLPQELIAQYPVTPRDSSRLMVVDRSTGQISHHIFRDLAGMLVEGDSLVLNDTKVLPARLYGKRVSGGKVEILLLRPIGSDRWAALAKPGKKVTKGDSVIFGDDFSCEILETLDDGSKVITFHNKGDFEVLLKRYGQIPLPHYMNREVEASDSENYQTVYASQVGAVAAPTAGLHFTPELLQKIKNDGVGISHITLHTGIGTFRPVQVDDIRDHKMHSEWFQITPEVATKLNARDSSRRQICVGTTCARALESAITPEGVIRPGSYETNIFIYPGYSFRYVNQLLTNFHLPGSSLLMLTCAFAGYELMMEAYSCAVKEKYRFFSYGDAMLII